jgi:hypothetical protein
METKLTIYEKLKAVKSEIGKISKDSTNPFFKSKYFDVNALLEHVEPLLGKNGLLLLQPIIDGKVSTGEKIYSEIELGTFTDPQKLGSAITYYRRYTLQSLLGLQAEDDDANHASQPSKAKEEDTRPWLDDKGLNFLEVEGTKEQILQAIAGRRMKKVFRERLDLKLKKL